MLEPVTAVAVVTRISLAKVSSRANRPCLNAGLGLVVIS